MRWHEPPLHASPSSTQIARKVEPEDYNSVISSVDPATHFLGSFSPKIAYNDNTLVSASIVQ